MIKSFIAIISTGILLVLLSACGALGDADPDYQGTVLPEPSTAADFSLTDAAGNQVTLSDFQDKIVLLYFGYTFCPDICPTTLADLARVQQQLDDQGQQIQVLMITVDPERDTPQLLADYVGHFHDTFIGLSGSPADIQAASEPYGVFVQKGEGTAETGYLVDHTSRVFVVDPDGNYYLSFGFATPVEDMIADLQTMLGQF